VFWFPLQLLSEVLLIVRKIQLDMIKMPGGIHVMYPYFLPDFTETWIFSTVFEKYWNIKFNKNPSRRSTRRVLEGDEGSPSRPGSSLSPGKSRYPLYRRLGGPQGRSGQVRKISPPSGFDPRTVQPVASRYTDYATRPTYTVHNSYRTATCFGNVVRPQYSTPPDKTHFTRSICARSLRVT